MKKNRMEKIVRWLNEPTSTSPKDTRIFVASIFALAALIVFFVASVEYEAGDVGAWEKGLLLGLGLAAVALFCWRPWERK